MGIGAGELVKANVDNETVYDIIQGVFNSFSAGILIYVGLVHLVGEELGNESHHADTAGMYSFCALVFVSMTPLPSLCLSSIF